MRFFKLTSAANSITGRTWAFVSSTFGRTLFCGVTGTIFTCASPTRCVWKPLKKKFTWNRILIGLRSISFFREIYFIAHFSLKSICTTQSVEKYYKMQSSKIFVKSTLLSFLVKRWFDGKNVDFSVKIVIVFYSNFPYIALSIIFY